MKKFWMTVDGFYSGARDLRKVFDARFKDPRKANSDRFVWDYWHIPDQYTALRTPAWEYFPQKMYERFHVYLRDWGRTTLGCYEISPPWLSNYVEGCSQSLHADVPHGPWAYVFSLAPPKPKYSGGETMLLRPEVLSYWKEFDSTRGLEMNDLTVRIPAKFGRLTVFDPRLPHAVTPVKGVNDPREGRLVIHGWFTEPRPFLDGPLTQKAATSVLNDALPAINYELSMRTALNGTLSIRFDISPSGKVTHAAVLANTLVEMHDDAEYDAAAVISFIGQGMASVKFPKARGKTTLTIPFIFR